MQRSYIIAGIGLAVVILAGFGVKKLVTSYPVETIKTIVAALKKAGITNPFAQAGILAVVSTEHGFVPKSEADYSKTSAARIRAVFDPQRNGRFANYTDAQIDVLKKDAIKFWDAVYGGKYGNTAVGDGYKYRGRGFNGITYKDAYAKYGKNTGYDLVNNPDLLNTVPVAAAVLAAFFADALATRVDTNSFRDLKTATFNAFRANAGWGNLTKIQTNQVYIDEHEHQLRNAPELLQIVQAA